MKLQSTLISVISHNHIILDFRKKPLQKCHPLYNNAVDIESTKGPVFCTFKIEFLLHYNTDNKNLPFHIVIHSTEAV